MYWLPILTLGAKFKKQTKKTQTLCINSTRRKVTPAVGSTLLLEKTPAKPQNKSRAQRRSRALWGCSPDRTIRTKLRAAADTQHNQRRFCLITFLPKYLTIFFSRVFWYIFSLNFSWSFTSSACHPIGKRQQARINFLRKAAFMPMRLAIENTRRPIPKMQYLWEEWFLKLHSLWIHQEAPPDSWLFSSAHDFVWLFLKVTWASISELLSQSKAVPAGHSASPFPKSHCREFANGKSTFIPTEKNKTLPAETERFSWCDCDSKI